MASIGVMGSREPLVAGRLRVTQGAVSATLDGLRELGLEARGAVVPA